jgi:hypothetical protein
VINLTEHSFRRPCEALLYRSKGSCLTTWVRFLMLLCLSSRLPTRQKCNHALAIDAESQLRDKKNGNEANLGFDGDLARPK